MVDEDSGQKDFFAENMDVVEEDVNGPILVSASPLGISLVTCSCLVKSVASEYCEAVFVRTLLLLGYADAETV